MDSVSEPNRRTVLAAAAAGAFGLAAPAAPAGSSAAGGDNAIRPFSINIPEEALIDLRRRINARSAHSRSASRRGRLTSFAGALKPRDGLSANW